MSKSLLSYVYLKAWEKIDKKDKERVSKQTLPKNIITKKYELSFKNRSLNYILYFKNNYKSNLPLMINVHGGGFIAGESNTNQLFNSYFTKEFNVISLGFSSAKELTLKDQLDDINFLIHEIINNKELNIDKNKIFLSGDSSGASLIVYLNLIYTNPKLLKEFRYESINFKGLLLTHSVPYINHFKDSVNITMKKSTDISMKKLLYKNDKEILSFLNDISIYFNYAFPPSVIITSLGDKAFTNQSELLNNDLKRKNIHHLFINIKDNKYNHIFNVLDPSDETSILVNDKAINYLLDTLKPKDPLKFELEVVKEEIILKN